MLARDVLRECGGLVIWVTARASQVGQNLRQMGQVAEPEILSGWKEIAGYLGKGVRTVQRYEHDLGLPVRRPTGSLRGAVIATKAELDLWVKTSPSAIGFRSQPESVRATRVELERLRAENAELRKAVAAAVRLLRLKFHFADLEHRKKRGGASRQIQ